MPRERAVAVDDEGTAVEHELVLAADLVDVDERKPVSPARSRASARALVELSRPRTASRSGPAAIPRRRAQGVLTLSGTRCLRRSEAQVECHGMSPVAERAGREDALLVEDAVVGQLVLEAQLTRRPRRVRRRCEGILLHAREA